MESRSIAAAAFDRPGVRVRTLAWLRWIAIGGQFATVVAVGLYLRYPLPWRSLIAAIAASAVLNLGLNLLYPAAARLNGRDLTLHLGFDLVQAGVLLFLTGGLANPFSILLVVPVVIGATLLPARSMGLLVALAGAVLAVLWHWSLPLPWPGPPPSVPAMYRIGVTVSLALAIGFLAIYVWRVSADARDRARALVATEAALTRETRMAALGSLAAAAAHELGGPLGTISLIAHSLAEALEGDPDFGDDIRLLESEAARSRAILVGIARRAEADDPFAILGLDALLHEVAHQAAPARVPVRVTALAPQPRMRRSPELRHGLANLVANAVRHAGSAVELHATTSGADICVAVLDDGPGFAPGMLPRLGEPDLGPSQSGSGGTGLGIFIATTLIERTGGRLTFGNRAEGGARVDIRWPRAQIEALET